MNYADVTARVNNKKAVVSDFSGINRYSGQRGLKDCENLCASEMPFLAVRGRRAALRALSSPQGIYADDTLAYVDGNRLYYGALEVSGLYLSSGEKQILRLGKYLIVLPDEVYCNTQDISDCGSMSAYFSSETGVSVSCVDEELSPILSYGVTTDEPDGANIGEYCAIKNDDGTYVIMQFDGNVWNEIKSYIKIAGSGIGAGFNVGDTVHCSGLGNVIGNHFTVTHKTADALFCEGAIAAAFTAMSVSIQRIFPRFDFCTVSEGRIYGVRRGRDKGGDFVSRIYASAKNDPFNYSPYCGGMYADVDISGAFTALCDRVGTPIAFSESDIVEIHSSGGWLYPHVIHCYGVESGAHKSAVCDSGIIYYKSSVGVCAYDGSYPECISGSLGRKLKCSEEGSPAICVGGKYYINLTENESSKAIYVYDTDKKVWFRENDPGVTAFAKRKEICYAMCADGIVIMNYDDADDEEKRYCAASVYPYAEESVLWSFESGRISSDSLCGIAAVNLFLRVRLPYGSKMRVSLAYDGKHESGDIDLIGEINGTVRIPLETRRCESVSLRVSGEGSAIIEGYALEYREGGEVRAWK